MTNHRLTPATTISEVVARIDCIIDRSVAQQDRTGLFAALYRHVATTFEEAVADQQFEHPALISKLDIVFFNRYLDAVEQYAQGQTCSACWQVAFEAARDHRPIVVQHLAMGMNAHINYDLAIAVADSIPRDKLEVFRADFERMNALLASLLDDVMDDLSDIWRWLRPIDRLLGNTEETLINFSMREVRDLAWDHALKLADAAPEERPRIERETDSDVTLLQRLLWQPLFPVNWGLRLVRWGEKGDVAFQINALRHTDAVERQQQKLRNSTPVPRSTHDEKLAESVPPPAPQADATPAA